MIYDWFDVQIKLNDSFCKEILYILIKTGAEMAESPGKETFKNTKIIKERITLELFKSHYNKYQKLIKTKFHIQKKHFEEKIHKI